MVISSGVDHKSLEREIALDKSDRFSDTGVEFRSDRSHPKLPHAPSNSVPLC